MTTSSVQSQRRSEMRVELYPQKKDTTLTGFDAGFLSFISYFYRIFYLKRAWGGDTKVVKRVLNQFYALPDDLDACRSKLKIVSLKLRKQVKANSSREIEILIAILMKFSYECLGQTPYKVQVAAVLSLMRGEIAQMGTGEGKSLTAAIAAAAISFRGQKVHVLTVNDYLAVRDAEKFKIFFDALGLSSGVITETSNNDERRLIYGSDIVFSAAKNVVFDYLKDKTSLGEYSLDSLGFKLNRIKPGFSVESSPILSGLDAVIIDEADSVLIDQAATPFILSGGEASVGGLNNDVMYEALQVIKNLDRDIHFKVFDQLKRVSLTENGKYVLGGLEYENSILNVSAIREHVVKQALVAYYLLEKGQDYLIVDGKVQIIDESTGRVMPDRQWSDGLHQLVELKENLELSEMRTTLGRITFQRFFPRYRHVCGMTGTAIPASRELWESYALRVRRILPRKPDKRCWKNTRVYTKAVDKWSGIATYVRDCHENNIPVLIGTRTVAASQDCSLALHKLNIPHLILNAEHVEEEANIICEAGRAGCVTVATNMAGRGTDIILSPLSRECGGLHVIISELHENRRIDLQLSGRCGRQGDPGTVARFLSLEDGLTKSINKWGLYFLTTLLRYDFQKLVYLYLLYLQQKQTRRAEVSRRRLQKYERDREKNLSLTGVLE